MTGSLRFLSGRVAKSLERMKRSYRPETTKSSQIFDTEMNELHSNMKSEKERKRERKSSYHLNLGPDGEVGYRKIFFFCFP